MKTETKTERKLKVGPGKIVLIPNKSRTMAGGIIVPDAHFDTSVCQVYAVGIGIHKTIIPNAVVMVNPAFAERAHHVLDKKSGMFICDAINVFGIIKRGRIYPIGKKVVVERNIGERKYNDVIVIPEAQKSTDQSLEGTVYGFGLLDKGNRYTVKGLKAGSVVRLKKWQEHMTEVGWKDKYYIFVNEDDIICEL